jgi:hypothetical protein
MMQTQFSLFVWLVGDADFFERTTQDSACFIDIEEKNTRLRSWEIIGRKREDKRARLDWGINTGHCSNYTHWPFGLGHQHGRALTQMMTEKTRAKPQLHPQIALMRVSKHWSEAHHRRRS